MAGIVVSLLVHLLLLGVAANETPLVALVAMVAGAVGTQVVLAVVTAAAAAAVLVAIQGLAVVTAAIVVPVVAVAAGLLLRGLVPPLEDIATIGRAAAAVEAAPDY